MPARPAPLDRLGSISVTVAHRTAVGATHQLQLCDALGCVACDASPLTADAAVSDASLTWDAPWLDDSGGLPSLVTDGWGAALAAHLAAPPPPPPGSDVTLSCDLGAASAAPQPSVTSCLLYTSPSPRD